MEAASRSMLYGRALADLAVLKLRRMARTGAPYSYQPRHATLCGARVRTYNLDTLAYLVREIFLSGCYEAGRLPERPVILDVGANIGIASLYFHLRYPTASITAVEADPDVFQLLAGNIRATMASRVTAVHGAAGEESGELLLYRWPGKPGRLTSSLERDRGGAEGLVVPALRLSSMVGDRVDLLKIDIEGAEHQVLRELAAAGALARVRQIIFELHTPGADPEAAARTLALLDQHDFSYEITGGAVDGHWSATDEAVLVRARPATPRTTRSM